MFTLLCGLSLLFFECVYEVEGGGTHSTPGNILFRPELSVTPPKSLKFSAGDIIRCPLNGVANHIMLAVSSTQVAEASVGSITDTTADIAVNNFNFKRGCEVDNKRFDELMFFTVARTPYSAENAVERARKDAGRRVYYNFIGCNCEHWVTYWKYGKPVSFQSLPGTIKNCQI
jgi:hypothetical protein